MQLLVPCNMSCSSSSSQIFFLQMAWLEREISFSSHLFHLHITMWSRAEASDSSSKPDKRAHVRSLEFVIQYHNILCKRTACRQIIRELGSHAMHAIFFSLGWRDPIGELRKLLGNRCRNGRLTKTFYKDGDGKSACVWARKRSVKHAVVNPLNWVLNGMDQRFRRSGCLKGSHPDILHHLLRVLSYLLCFFFLGEDRRFYHVWLDRSLNKLILFKSRNSKTWTINQTKENQSKGCVQLTVWS